MVSTIQSQMSAAMTSSRIDVKRLPGATPRIGPSLVMRSDPLRVEAEEELNGVSNISKRVR